MNLGLSGLASGFDWQSLIDQLIAVGRAPETRMRAEQSTLAQRKNAYATINTQLSTLKSRAETLSKETLFSSRLTGSSDTNTATSTVESGATVGSYLFHFTQLASAAKQRGTQNISKPLNATNDVSSLVLSNAPFSTALTGGTITVNGKQVSIATTDTLQAVFDKIQTATGGVVSASYDSATDKINLTSAQEIVLGSTTDTSNFLQVAQLRNNGSGAVSSSSSVGGVRLSSALTSANLTTTVSDGGSGAGEFKINGVSISFNTSTDSVQNVLDRINNSAAGVTASYDSINDRFTLANESTGDVGVALEDVTGNFLSSTGLLNGTLERGKNLLYTINGGAQLTSQSNSVTSGSSGLTGLSVSALKLGDATVTISNDTEKIKTAIKDFLTDYNKAQSLIDTQSASSTDAKGVVTAGILASDSTITELAGKLRSLTFSPGGASTSAIRSLADLGVDSNGKDNSLTLTDDAKLDEALSGELDSVTNLFTKATTGLAVQLKDYLETTTKEGGTLATRQDIFTKQSGEIDNQITALERRLAEEQQRLTDTFVAMESAQAKIKEQLSYLTKNFGTT